MHKSIGRVKIMILLSLGWEQSPFNYYGTFSRFQEKTSIRQEINQRFGINSPYASREGVTEELKAENQMEWVRRMNSIRDRVEGIICSELIYD